MESIILHCYNICIDWIDLTGFAINVHTGFVVTIILYHFLFYVFLNVCSNAFALLLHSTNSQRSVLYYNEQQATEN